MQNTQAIKEVLEFFVIAVERELSVENPQMGRLRVRIRHGSVSNLEKTAISAAVFSETRFNYISS